jgi:anaerobic magnesium-protoporphyrin IX monomethyl ester cyclase
MKVLLINPNSSLISRSWAYKKFFTPIAPLGLAYIAGVLIKNGIEASIIDQFATKASDNEMLGLIKTENPQVIGFSAMTPTMPDIMRLVSRIRKEQRRIKIVLGNIHATCFPEEVLKDDIADIVVRGEGEVTMLELCQRLGCGSDLKDLAGISFKSDGQITHNPDRELIEDLDSLPFPYWHLLNLDDYRDVPLVAINKARAFPIMASRGCPYRCYYCSQDKVYNRVRYRNLEKVVDEMEYFSDKFEIKYFGFNDAYFPADEKTGLEFCNLIIKHKLHKKIKWCTETRVDKVTARLLKAMKESGAHLIMYGIEVGNEKILRSLNKATTLEQARVALKETRKAGILSQGLFILGLPGETVATCEDSINFAKELDCDIVKFNLAMPYPGSRFFDDYRKTNKIDRPEKFTSWFDWLSLSGSLVYTPEDIDSYTLRYLQRKAMFEFYVRPKVIFRHLFRKTISFNNLFYGSLWLIFLFWDNFFNALKRFWIRAK